MHRTTEQHHPIDRLYRSLEPEDTSTAVSVIVKLRGETCDIDCPTATRSARRCPAERGSAPTRSASWPGSSGTARSPSSSTAGSR